MKNYIHMGDKDYIKVEVYYSKGGMNYFNGKVEPRGYWLSVAPVQRSNEGGVVIESWTAFTGRKRFLLEVKRQSDKAMTTAIGLAKQFEEEMVALFTTKTQAQ